jgi:integrase
MAQVFIAYRDAGKSDRFLAPIEDYWKDTPVSNATPGAIKQSALALYPKAGNATRNRQVIVPTQAAINHAAELEWCPPIRVKRFPVIQKVKKPADLAWVQAFQAAASPHLGALCLFMFATGARIGEAVAMTWDDVDLERRTALVRQTKVANERLVHLPGPLFEAIANIPSNRMPSAPVFNYSARDNVRKVWDSVIERAGIEKLSPHCCRHGFATTMLRAGKDVKTVASLGGWKDVATLLKVYAHAIEDRTQTDVIFDTPVTQPRSKSA